MTESEPTAGHHEPPIAQTDASTPMTDASTPMTDASIPSTDASTPATGPSTPGAEGQPTPAAEPGLEPDVEIVDGLPVVAEVRTIERPSPASLPAVQVVAVAATGFVAGAATVVLARRRSARKLVRNGRGGSRRAADVLPIAASRSFLVDVHVIAKPE